MQELIFIVKDISQMLVSRLNSPILVLVAMFLLQGCASNSPERMTQEKAPDTSIRNSVIVGGLTGWLINANPLTMIIASGTWYYLVEDGESVSK